MDGRGDEHVGQADDSLRDVGQKVRLRRICPLREVVESARARPDVLISGALPGFKTGYKSAMYTNTMSRTIHIADVGIADRHLANNAYERFNWMIKDRTARVRGFNSGDPPLVRLLLAYHNFIRPHGGLGGKTPAEAADIIIKGDPANGSNSHGTLYHACSRRAVGALRAGRVSRPGGAFIGYRTPLPPGAGRDAANPRPSRRGRGRSRESATWGHCRRMLAPNLEQEPHGVGLISP